MNFLQPWMLLGLLAAFVPVILHLLHRQKAQRIRFPMMTIVAKSQEQRAPALKLKRWLLLAARILILLLIPLAMAQPYTLCGGSASTVSDRYPAAVVVVLDVSASMSRDQGQALHAQAVEDARRVIRQLRPWDQVRVLSAGQDLHWLNERWSTDHSSALRALEELRWEHGHANIPAALIEARSALVDAQLPAKRVVVISDNNASSWRSDSLQPGMLQGLGELRVLPLKVDASLVEFSVEELAWEEASQGGQDMVELQARITARGEGRGSATVRMEVDGNPAGAQPVELEAGESQTLRFMHAFDGLGAHQVRVLVDGPGVRSLQERWLPVHLSQAVRALLVNGASSAVQTNDELYYLTRALDVDVGERQAIRKTVITPERLADQRLEDFDVVMLANVEALSPSEVDALRAFVHAGGGLWITPGSLVRPEHYNRIFGDLLPRPLRSVTKLSSPDDPDANIRATRFASIDHDSPLFRIFAMRGGESLQSARVFSYLLLEPDPSSEAKVLASYGDGGPAVVEKSHGAGRVLLWTTTVDQDWTDLPIRTAFLPLVHRSIRHLAQRGASDASASEVGTSLSFDLAGLNVDQLSLVSRSGARHVLEVTAGFASFVPQEIGVFEVSFMRGGNEFRAAEYDFAVNAPVDEAVFEAADEALVSAWTEAAAQGVQSGDVADVEENRRRTWPALLLVGLFLLYLESLLSVRRRAWTQLRGAVAARRA